ncbi:hypothetical protein [Campylobacter sp. B0100352/1]|uniref:hypothetical protein n=1 Tax=Campylobacter sp. B0100352/1 TaxID=2735783 RepID=UPI00301DCAFF
MNKELEKESLVKEDLNETEKDLQIPLKEAGVDEIGERLLKEIEDENKTEDTTSQQDKIQTMKGATGYLSDGTDALKQTFKKLEPYLLPFKIIIKRADNTLGVIDALIEYQKTGDGLKVIVKIGSETVASKLFIIGAKIAIQAAISAFVAIAIFTGSATLGILAGIAIVGTAMVALWWINSKIESWLKEYGISFVDVMREFETHLSLGLTSNERYYYNLAHCHKTQIKNMQKIQLYYNGKIVKDLKHYYFPFYDFKKTPILNNTIEKTNELQNNYKVLSPKDTIDNININSEPYLLKALYFCENFTSLNQNNQALLNTQYIGEKFPYNSSFYIIFLLHKNKITDTYLQARKELYKSIIAFNQIQNKNILEQNKENFQEYNLTSHSKNLNHFILENKDKNKRIIFLNNASSMSNLIHIYDNHCDIFIKDESLLDIKMIEKEYDIKFKKLNARVFFYEKLLLGACENNPFSFEDKKENLIYYFKYDKEDLNSLKDLNIKYDYYNAKIKNYSLLEESLNIKLELKELKKGIVYKDTSFNKLSKEPLDESSSNAKEPQFITLYLKDEYNKPIANAKIIIKGFKHDEALRVVNLKRRSDEKGKIRFDKEKYFSDCYSFKVKLDEEEAYFPTPIQNAKRIFNNYTEHKIGLILKFKAKDHLVYDGFNVYHYKGNDLINSYIARSGTAKADNEKRSKKQIANYFYPNNNSKSGKAYFYYDDESIQDKFGTLPEGMYYLKINEIAKDIQPSFLKDYPFEIGQTWGKYCVRLYTDKECSKTSKEVKTKEDQNKKDKKNKKEQSIIKDNLYLYSINERGEFGSSGSIGMAQSELLENLSKQVKFIRSEKEGIVSLKVEYPKKEKSKLKFIKTTEWDLDEDEDIVSAEKGAEIIVDEKANFAPGTYLEYEVHGLKDDVNIVWALAQIQNEERLQRILEGKENLEFKDVKFLKDESKYFHECWEMDDEEKEEEFNKIGFSLPLTRANEEEFDKYYALVFAYEDKNKFKRLPNLNDAYKIIDMSFRVGWGRDDQVKELFTREELKNTNIYHLNRQQSINSIEEANWFLRACLKNQEKRDFFTYLRIYPQFAGKIAYIYYRFDIVNKGLLASVSEKDKEAYLRDRDFKYINTIVNEILPSEYKDGKSFNQFHTDLLNNKNRDLKECKDFLKALTQTLCKRFDLPLEKVIFYNEKPSGSLSFGSYEDNEVRLNQYIMKAYFKEFAKTVFHECRHFYIEKHYSYNMDALGRYIFYSEKAYINEKIIFDKFNRICDPSENYLVGCNIGSTQDAYEIQPNERDPRYVETFIGRNL